jgi:hypothetical protein
MVVLLAHIPQEVPQVPLIPPPLLQRLPLAAAEPIK